MLFVIVLKSTILDGFDIDYEPGYGHSGTSLANYQTISPMVNNKMQVFIETL
ncbi:hypothetical protein NXX05_24110 [Bacteroides thetaiotaomicron]|uniref:hypothetical protein n=1 Tax=Bacteroides thetaiotaomicron TaxID=818 RepID=UPI002165C324|nr:hypothetical protein [Bacteroides thetaiotaomicron]MCS2850447.1 hypothetical protein [Bacteroides thetaiotaomicron]